MSDYDYTLVNQAIANGWKETYIGFYEHPDYKPYWIDQCGGDGDCYYVMKGDCSEVWSVAFSYEELIATVTKPDYPDEYEGGAA